VAGQITDIKTRLYGLFIVHDLCATVCMQCLKVAGIKIPRDNALDGFNNDIVSRIAEFKLTFICL
jgi:LacI family transcriptional regulator